MPRKTKKNYRGGNVANCQQQIKSIVNKDSIHAKLKPDIISETNKKCDFMVIM